MHLEKNLINKIFVNNKNKTKRRQHSKKNQTIPSYAFREKPYK